MKAFHEHELSYGETDRELYGARETGERIRVADAVGSTWTPHGARLHPVKLVKGLAAAVEALGVVIHESTPVTEIRPKHAVTPYGTVRAPYVLRCTEGFTASLKGQRRTWLPMNSSMIATEPLTDAQWESVGWGGLETLGDMAHAYMYAQRTADGRIALGGRGCRIGSGRRPTTTGGRRPLRSRRCGRFSCGSFRRLRGCGLRMRGRGFWGASGLVRDGDVGSGHGAGVGRGYVGSGVATTNLAARTLRDLVQLDSGQAGATELTGLPWVGHAVRKWEPEPFRWLGVQGMYATYRAADRRESAGYGVSSSRLARWADRVAGRG